MLIIDSIPPIALILTQSNTSDTQSVMATSNYENNPRARCGKNQDDIFVSWTYEKNHDFWNDKQYFVFLFVDSLETIDLWEYVDLGEKVDTMILDWLGGKRKKGT